MLLVVLGGILWTLLLIRLSIYLEDSTNMDIYDIQSSLAIAAVFLLTLVVTYVLCVEVSLRFIFLSPVPLL
jgi:membrane protein DedA with SNARE-associated domain